MNTTSIPFQIRSNYGLGRDQAPYGANYRNFPVRLSIPVAEGTHRPEQAMQVRDGNGKVVPAFIRPFLSWGEGSVRAWDVCFHETLNLGEFHSYEFLPTDSRSAHEPKHDLFLIEPRSFFLFVTLKNGTTLKGQADFDHGSSSPFLADQETTVSLKRGKVEMFRAVLTRRLWASYPGVELALRLTNVGPDDSVVIREARIEFDLPLEGQPEYVVEQYFYSRNREMPIPRFVASRKPFILQSNAGDVRVTDIRQLNDDPKYYPSYERPGAAVVAPWIAAGDAKSTWLLMVDEACERFPKRWRFEKQKAIVQLHPKSEAPLEWRQGMTMFQRIHLVRFSGKAKGEQLRNEAWAWQRPPLVKLGAEQYRAAGWRIPFQYKPGQFPKIENKFQELFRFAWYPGTFYWGDESEEMTVGEYLALPAHERHRARPRNGEYDITAAAAKEYARTGHTEFMRMCRNAAEHMMYTDFVEVSHDEWKQGGVPAHGRNHTSGAAYPSHMWIEGLTLYHQLSGDPNAVRVGRRIGDFVLKYLHERPGILLGTAREGGWALIALGALYDLTREEKYLVGIRKIADLFLGYKSTDFCSEDGSFMVGIALIGLDRVRPFYRSDEIQKQILAVLDWQIEKRMSPGGMFDFHYDAEKGGNWSIQAAMPEALNIGYKLSGDERYLRVAFRQFQFWEAGTLFHVLGNDVLTRDSRVAACSHLSWMGCLQSFAETGWLDQMQFSDPPSRIPGK